MPFAGISAQISGIGNFKIYNTFAGIDFVVIFDGIDNDSELNYSGDGSVVLWYKYSDRTNPVSNFKYITPEDNTGYILDVDGEQKSIWVFDYRMHIPQITSLAPAQEQFNDCEVLSLKITTGHSDLIYESLAGRKYTIDRFFKLLYKSLEWSDADKK